MSLTTLSLTLYYHTFSFTASRMIHVIMPLMMSTCILMMGPVIMILILILILMMMMIIVIMIMIMIIIRSLAAIIMKAHHHFPFQFRAHHELL